MRRVVAVMIVGSMASLWTLPAAAKKCPPDSVAAGQLCVDTYEASVWQVPARNPSGHSNAGLLRRVQAGKATVSDLQAGGATQMGGATTSACTGAEYPSTFPVTGNWTVPLYALSLPGVLPSTCLSWFQAQQACQLVGKQLLTNDEWQGAAVNTPSGASDDGANDCNTVTAGGPVATGSRSLCGSNWGTFDMTGNVDEWVADWGEMQAGCATWPAPFSGTACFGGDGSFHLPTAPVRGGSWSSGSSAGIFTIRMDVVASDQQSNVGFRCGRRP